MQVISKKGEKKLLKALKIKYFQFIMMSVGVLKKKMKKMKKMKKKNKKKNKKKKEEGKRKKKNKKNKMKNHLIQKKLLNG